MGVCWPNVVARARRVAFTSEDEFASGLNSSAPDSVGRRLEAQMHHSASTLDVQWMTTTLWRKV